MNLVKMCIIRAKTVNCCRKYSKEAAKQAVEKSNLSLIRNIGILAHIDAGKTTTTERMLYYSGMIGQMGEVHHGNTVTDFMEQERQRGITITSASVTFDWEKHRINLLDTPGHIDFTMEVEQTLNVMDGAIVILDGSAGVEAQTVTVWRQADRYRIPRIVYVNKMDKPGAGFFESIKSLKKHLCVVPVVIQLPIMNRNKLEGIVDLLSVEKCQWDGSISGDSYSRTALSPEDGELWENAVNARSKLTETLADLDDRLAEAIINEEKDQENLPASTLKESIRKITLEHKGVPVLCGSSYKNLGVQLLMDSVIDYLPSPLSAPSHNVIEYFGNNLCARAFKVRHDDFKGPITFFRIYSGNLVKGQKIYNIWKEKSEVCGKLYVAYADDYEEVPEIGQGNIVAVTGLKLTKMGELVTSTPAAFQSAQKAMGESKAQFLRAAFIPDPVFFCSIEAPSQSTQAALDKALSELEREDPSLRVTVNDETGQTVLGGMGELHLEVIRERIRSEYKVDADLGTLQIAYKEALVESTRGSHSFEGTVGSSFQSVKVEMSVLKTEEKEAGQLLLDRSPDYIENVSAIYPRHLVAVRKGVESALQNGPKLNSPVINVNVMLHKLEVGRGTSDSLVRSTCSQCVRKLLKTGGTRLLEPIMLVEVACNEKIIEAVLNDFGNRRGELESTEARALDVVIRSLVPLSELLGYSKELRILTSGAASFSMEFNSLREMKPEDEAKAIRSVHGFD